MTFTGSWTFKIKYLAPEVLNMKYKPSWGQRVIHTDSIGVALINWYIENSNFEQEILSHLEAQSSTYLLSRDVYHVGKQIATDMSMMNAIESSIMADKCSANMYAFIKHASPYSMGYFETIVHEQIGLVVKNSGWFDRNKKEIEAEKRKIKVIRKVLNV